VLGKNADKFVKLNDSLRSENNGKMTKIFKKIGFFLG
jgi:hypothetical protein